MKTIDELLNTTRYCYWLDEKECESAEHPHRFRVCLVFEGEPGYRKSGGGDVLPWYWNEMTCREKNRRRGLSEADVDEIVCSSMFANV